jgi:hypothetical protein
MHTSFETGEYGNEEIPTATQEYSRLAQSMSNKDPRAAMAARGLINWNTEPKNII